MDNCKTDSCLIILSSDCPLSCIWDWRSNVVGHIFSKPFNSNHVNGYISDYFKAINIFTDSKKVFAIIYDLALLCPDDSRGRHESGNSLPIFVTQTTVGYLQEQTSITSKKVR